MLQALSPPLCKKNIPSGARLFQHAQAVRIPKEASRVHHKCPAHQWEGAPQRAVLPMSLREHALGMGMGNSGVHALLPLHLIKIKMLHVLQCFVRML